MASRTNGRFVFAGLVAALSTLLYGSLVILGALLRFPRAWMDPLCRLWARWILLAAGIRVKLEDIDQLPDEPAVLICNHQGVFEILALIAFLPRQPVFVAKAEAFKVPVFGPALVALGHIAVDRDDRDKAIASIRKGAAGLRARGDQVVFFPEGTRTRDGRLKEFKKGAFVFALESKLPLVPIAVDGSYQALPPKQKVVNPGLVRMRFLPPIPVTGLSMDDRDALLEQSKARIAAALDQMRGTQPLPAETPLPESI